MSLTQQENPKHIVYTVLTQTASKDGSKYQEAKHIADPVVTGTLYLSPSLRNPFI
jgi:hypothetical protein